MKHMKILSSGALAVTILMGTVVSPAMANQTEDSNRVELASAVVTSNAPVSVQSVKGLMEKAGQTIVDTVDVVPSKEEEAKEAAKVRAEVQALKEGQIDVVTKDIELKAPKVIEEETDELFVGETKLKSESKNGKAIKITTTSKDKDGNVTVNHKVNVVTPSKAQVVLVGTKVRPTYNEGGTAISAASVSVDNGDGSTHSETEGIVNTPGSQSNVETWIPSSKYQAVAQELSEGTDDELLKLALQQVGKRYVWGAEGPSSFDCSGLVHYVYAQNGGKSIPRTAYAQGLASTPVARADIQPGDILWSKTHVGIYIGDNKMVHAANPSKGVAVDDINYYLNKGMKIGRL